MSDDNHASMMLTLLERATGLSGHVTLSGGVAYPSGMSFFPGAYVKFPPTVAGCADRAGMWVGDGGMVFLRTAHARRLA